MEQAPANSASLGHSRRAQVCSDLAVTVAIQANGLIITCNSILGELVMLNHL